MSGQGSGQIAAQTQTQIQHAVEALGTSSHDAPAVASPPKLGKRAAAEIARIEAMLARLRERVLDLHMLQRAHEESSAVLATRLQAVEQRPVVSARLAATSDVIKQVESLSAQIGDLRAQTALLSSTLSGQSKDAGRTDAEMEALFARVQTAEAALASAQTRLAALDQRLLAAETSAPRPHRGQTEAIAQLERRVSLALDGLQEQQGRLDAVAAERGDNARDDALRQRIDDLRLAFEARIGGLDQSLEGARAQALKLGEAGQKRLDSRLGRLWTALMLFALAIPLLVGVVWWQSTRHAGLTELRIDRLAAELERAADAAAPDAGAITAALRDGFARLERQLEGQSDRPDALPAVSSAVSPPGGRPSGEWASRPGLAPVLAPSPLLPAETDTPTQLSMPIPAPSAVPEPLTPEMASPPALRSAAEPQTGPAGAVDSGPRWMIQLIGFYDLDEARSFADAQDLRGNAWILESRFRNRPWYSLLTGAYADRADAAAAITELPAVLRTLEPIVRRLESSAGLRPVD